MIKRKFKNLFLKIYHNEKRIIKRYYLIEKINILIFIVTLISSFVSKDNEIILNLLSFVFLINFILLVIILTSYKIFKKHVGIYIYLEEQDVLTSIASELKIPKKLKISGLTGAGKDTFASGLIQNNIKNIKNRLEKLINNITDLLYMIDFDLLNNTIIENKNQFDVQHTKSYDNQIKKILADNNNFLLERFSNISCISDFIEEMFTLKSINDLLITYIKTYHRLKCVDNYVLSNQPYIEDTKQQIPAKIFSLDYLKTNHEIKEKTDIKTKKKEYYQEKVFFPIIHEGVIVFETEVDALYNNLDEDVKKMLKKGGLRNTKAFDRHIFGENYFNYAVGQNHSRVNKSLRELDHGYATIIEREEIPGKRYKILKLDKKIEKCRKRIYKNEKRKTKLLKYKFKKIVLYLKNKNYTLSEKVSKYSRLKKLYEENGYIVMLVSITRNETGTPVEVSLNELMSKANYIVNYTTKFVFKMNKCRGTYNTHYLEMIREYFKNKSEITWDEIPNWDLDLKLKEKHIKEMNYSVFNNFLNIKEEEMLLKKYKKTDKKTI